MIQGILFDVDGTLIDTEQVMLETLQKALRQERNLDKSLEELRFIFGIPGLVGLKKMGVQDPEQFIPEWKKIIQTRHQDMQFFNGMSEVLQTLATQKTPLGIVTSKTQHNFDTDFTPFGIDHYFKTVVTADDTNKHKPHPEPLELAMTRLELSADKTIYVGDTLYDYQCAKGAGAKFALATWGAHEGLDLPDVDVYLNEPKDLLTLI